MKCPDCGREGKVGTVHGEPAEMCAKCGGIWLETGALRAFFERILDHDPKLKPKKAKADAPLAGTFYKMGRNCPECGEQMEKTYYAYDSGIPIEHCVPCGGTWVDKPEIDRIALYLKDNAQPIVYTGGAPVEHAYELAFTGDPRFAWLRPVFAAILAVVCAASLVYAGRILYGQTVALQAATESLGWLEIGGVLEDISIEPGTVRGIGRWDDTIYAIRKRYTYSFLGKAYESYASWPNGDDLMTRDRRRAQRAVAFFEPSTPISVFVDPENPARACLLQGTNPYRKRHNRSALVFQSVVSALGFVGAAWSLFRWRYPAE